MARDDFSTKTIEDLKKRAAYICSNPDCRVSTVAPSSVDENEIIYNGIIAHISAASGGGARYDKAMSSDERKHISNGLFLCANCSIAIDKNNGKDYTADQLKEWKTIHEDWVRENLNKRPQEEIVEVSGEISASGVGEVIGLHIQKGARIMPGTKVTATGIGNITGTKIGQ